MSQPACGPVLRPRCAVVLEKETLISTLSGQVDALVARVAALETENAALREKLKALLKTPDNSGTPPSQGERRWQARPEGQGARRSAPPAASQPDPLRGGPRGALPPLPRRRGRRGPGGGADLRPHRDPRDRSGRDAGGLARRRVRSEEHTSELQ